MKGLLDIEFAWLPFLLELLGKGESRAFGLCSRALHEHIAPHTKQWAEQKWSWIHSMYHRGITDLLGGPYAMMRMPRLTWDPRFIGGTGYIDGIAASDMHAPVMLGCISMSPNASHLGHGRPYIAIRSRGAGKQRASVTVLFQRYSVHKGTWASSDNGGIITECGHFMVNGDIKHELLAFNIQNLLEGKRSIMRFTRFVGQDIHSVPRWLE